MSNKIYIGIDTGVSTGFAIWDSQDKEFLQISTYKIHVAMRVLESHIEHYNIHVIVEDARKVRFFKHEQQAGAKARAQGAGSVKRDAVIWEDFLTDLGVSFEMVRPSKKLAKLDAKTFKAYTGITTRLSQHARDAAMLVFNK